MSNFTIPANASIVKVDGGDGHSDVPDDSMGHIGVGILTAAIIVILLFIIPMVAFSYCRPMTKKQRRRSRSRSRSRSSSQANKEDREDQRQELIAEI